MIDVVTVFAAVATDNMKKFFAEISIFSLFIVNSSTIVFSSKMILSNEMIIYDFNNIETMQSLRQIVEFFFNLWNDIEFVTMKINNWMKILFKFNWKIKVSEKTKIYSLDQKNRNLMNDTFHQLHRNDKLSWIIEFISFNYSFFCVWKTTSKDERKRKIIIDIREFNAII